MEKITLLGIDEVGRGCVIGPMVICGLLIEKNKINNLKDLKVKDSKKLSPKKRKYLTEKIIPLVMDFKIIEIPINEINKRSLNELEIEKVIDLIKIFQPDELYFDAPTHGRGLKEYENLFKFHIKNSAKVVVENNADNKYEIVSAASIIAKVYRDNIITSYYTKYGDLGSGYPSDIKTINFLKSWYEKNKKFPNIVRTKWKTIYNIIGKKQLQLKF